MTRQSWLLALVWLAFAQCLHAAHAVVFCQVTFLKLKSKVFRDENVASDVGAKFLFLTVLALVIWILVTTHKARKLPCASEEWNGHNIGNIWDYSVYLLVLCGPLQMLVATIIARSSSGKGRMLSHTGAAIVQARPLSACSRRLAMR